MKCNSKRTLAKKQELAREKAQKERDEMLSAMSKEEREEFLDKEREENQAACKRAEKVLMDMALISACAGGPYGKI